MTYTIEAMQRESGTADMLRSSGRVPGVLYGPEIQPISLSVPAHAFGVLLEKAKGASLVDIVFADAKAPVTAVIQDVQYDPISGRITHVDFRQINLKKEMKVPVTFRFVNESIAVKGLGGTLIKALSEVEIKCLPQDLIGFIDVDLSLLKTFDDVIRVRDLSVGVGVVILGDAETVVAKVTPPLTEDQLKAMEEGTGPKSLEDIEVEEKGKKEEAGEEGAEQEPVPSGEEPKK